MFWNKNKRSKATMKRYQLTRCFEHLETRHQLVTGSGIVNLTAAPTVNYPFVNVNVSEILDPAAPFPRDNTIRIYTDPVNFPGSVLFDKIDINDPTELTRLAINGVEIPEFVFDPNTQTLVRIYPIILNAPAMEDLNINLGNGNDTVLLEDFTPFSDINISTNASDFTGGHDTYTLNRMFIGNDADGGALNIVPGDGNYVIEVNDTTVFGPVVIDAQLSNDFGEITFNNTVVRGQFLARMGSNDETLILNNVTINGLFGYGFEPTDPFDNAARAALGNNTLLVNMGDGDDVLSLGSLSPVLPFDTIINGPISITMDNLINGVQGDGDDAVIFASTSIPGTLSIVTAAGNDTVDLLDSDFFSAYTLDTGAGDNIITLQNDLFRVNGKLFSGVGSQTLNIDTVEFRGLNNVFNIGNTTTSALFTGTININNIKGVGTVIINTGKSNDTLTLTNSSIKTIKFYTSGGNDNFTVTNNVINEFLASLGDGDDVLTMTNNKFTFSMSVDGGAGRKDKIVRTKNIIPRRNTTFAFETKVIKSEVITKT